MLKQRIITAAVLIGILIPVMFFLPNVYWAALTLLLSLFAINEWSHMIGLNTPASLAFQAIFLTVGALFVWIMIDQGFHVFFYQSLIIFAICALFWTFVMLFWLKGRFQFQSKWLMAAIGFLLLFSFWLALVCAKGADPKLLLILMATIWIADTAAYFSGKNFGKHKLAPNISPGKTWEGVLGALLAVTAFGLTLFVGFDINQPAIFLLLLMVAVLGVVGDLFESMLKRQANMKDSGHILPGHGGVLDRIDGLIPSLPIGILMIYVYHYFQAVS